MYSLGSVAVAEKVQEHKKARLLIVDDEPKVRAALANWFKLKGYAVDEAGDGLEAIMKCREGQYDLITMDIEMPCMNGMEAIPLIRKDFPGLPIIVLTGFMLESSTLLENNVFRVLYKPLRPSELEKHIAQALGYSQ